VSRPAPTVTKESIEAKTKTVKYLVDETLTICIITLENGTKVVGVSACVYPENFDKGMGERIAYENAFNQIWGREGYLLAEKRYQEGKAAPTSPPL